MPFRDRLTGGLWRTAAVGAGIALLAAACGGSDNTSTSAVTTPAASQPAAAAGAASPTATATSGQSRTFVDATGKSFTIEKPPKRVAALSPSVVELMYAVGATPIARPSSANYPEQAKSVTAVGSSYQPNLEQIAAQNPDFIITDAQIHSPQIVSELAKLGVPVFSIRVQHVADVMASLRLMGNIMGMSENGEKAAKDLETKLDNVQAKLPPADQRPTVFLMIGTADAFWGAKPDAFSGDVIARLGAKNLVETGPDTTQFPGFTSYSMEQLVALDPDVILVMSVSPNAPPTTKQLAGNPAWNGLRAVKSGRVQEVNTEALVQAAGPRVGDVIDMLFPILYPGR